MDSSIRSHCRKRNLPCSRVAADLDSRSSVQQSVAVSDHLICSFQKLVGWGAKPAPISNSAVSFRTGGSRSGITRSSAYAGGSAKRLSVISAYGQCLAGDGRNLSQADPCGTTILRRFLERTRSVRARVIMHAPVKRDTLLARRMTPSRPRAVSKLSCPRPLLPATLNADAQSIGKLSRRAWPLR